jgi:hypothetical protein
MKNKNNVICKNLIKEIESDAKVLYFRTQLNQVKRRSTEIEDLNYIIPGSIWMSEEETNNYINKIPVDGI